MDEVKEFLQDIAFPHLDVDWSSESLQRTPERFVKMLGELTTPEEFEFRTFPANGTNEMIVMQDIPVVSLCEHHVVPFVGVAHIAYIPHTRGRVAGLSKLARAVRYCAAGLRTQEVLTEQIHDFIDDKLSDAHKALGIGVILQCEHMCMTIRGVQTPGTRTTTSKMSGVFLNSEKHAREEFLTLIGRG